jgi:hypothetical protein
MGTRPATIREAQTVLGRAAWVWSLPLSRAFAILLLLLGSSFAARAQTPTLGNVSSTSTALAVNANNESGQTVNALLNNDSSVVLVQNGALTGQSCQGFFTTGLVNFGAAFYDSSTSTIYVAMIYNSTLYAGYETLTSTPGTCTQEPLLALTSDPNENLEMNADLAAGSMYIVNSSGALQDMLYVLPTAPWVFTPTPVTQTLDYSAGYGPIVIDPSSHFAYINDLGDNTAEAPGTQKTDGFFVYNPPPANQIEWVTGYFPAGDCTTNTNTEPTAFYISTLLNNGNGELVLINANPTASTSGSYLTTPITALNTTYSGFNIFTSTCALSGDKVDLTPAGALTTISATAQYSTISAADLDAAASLVYAFAFDEESETNPTPTTGLLLEYNLAPSSGQPQEVLLSSSMPMPQLDNEAGIPWGQLNYNPVTSQAVLSANNIESGALGVTSSLCPSSSTTPTLTTLYGSSSAYLPLDFPVINTASGYAYAVQPEIYGTEPPTPPTLNYVAPLPSTCTGSSTYTIGGSVSGLSSGASVTLLDNGGGSLPVTANGPFTFAMALASGSAYSVTVATQPAGEICSVANGAGTVASANITDVAVTCVSGTPLEISPATLKTGIVGTNYTEGLTASGGSGSGYTWTVLAGSALSAAGLTLESDNGEIFGVPSAVETAAPFTVEVTDSLGDTAAMNYNLTIYPILGIGPSSLSVATVGTAYLQAFTATGGSGAGYTWTLLAGGSQITALDLSLSPSGVLSGTPNAAGSVSFGIQVTDSAGDTAVGAYTLTVAIGINDPETITVNDSNTQVSVFNVSDPETITVTDIDQVTVAPPLSITTSSPLPPATLYTPYSVTLAASGGSGTGYTWQALEGGAGLTYVGLALSSAGVISGTPSTTSAAITFTVLVTDSLGNTAIKTLVLTVGNPVPVITSTSPAYATAGSGEFDLVVFGSGFLSSSTINWNGTALSTTLAGTLLSAEVPASDILSAGIANVTVVTPGPGVSTTSAVWQFEISPSGSGTGTPPVVTPVSVSISPGSSATYSITLPAGATKISVECLNLPSGASCSFTKPTLTITTSTSTPAGTYTIVAVFTYTVPGAASSSLIFLPLLLLPLVLARKRWAKARIVLIACVVLGMLTLTNIGCGGGPTHQATSTAGVTLVVQ